MNGASLDARLEKLRAAGWTLRRVYTLKRLDRDEVQNFYGEKLDDVVRRAEARERVTKRRPQDEAA